MENLHLKNIIQKPNPLIILKKLKDIEHDYKNKLHSELIIDIHEYLKTLEFKNKEIERFIAEFFNNILYGRINSYYNIPIQVITLLHKHKLNHLDVGSKINIDEFNKFFKNNDNCILIIGSNILYTYNYSRYRQAQLMIYTKNKTNEISNISYEIL
jgi:hypothetical protein